MVPCEYLAPDSPYVKQSPDHAVPLANIKSACPLPVARFFSTVFRFDGVCRFRQPERRGIVFLNAFGIGFFIGQTFAWRGESFPLGLNALPATILSTVPSAVGRVPSPVDFPMVLPLRYVGMNRLRRLNSIDFKTVRIKHGRL